MKGRYEQPKKGRKKTAPRPSDSWEQNYGNNPYGSQPYDQQTYQGGYSQNPQQDAFQNNIYGGDSYSEPDYTQQSYGDYPYEDGYEPQQPQKGGFWWGVLAFFVPIAGLILWIRWRRTKPSAAKHSGRGALIGFILQLILIFALVAGGALYYNHMLGKVNYVEMDKPTYPAATEALTEPSEEVTETTAAETEPKEATREDFVNFLIVGQAARANEAERFADTMLVCTLNKFDNSLTVTSLLRDSFVQPPPFRDIYFGKIKLTTVYHMGSYYDHGNVAGSMELMNATLYDNFGLEIDHNLEISFDVFEQIINSLGGVDLEINEAEAKYMNKVCATADWTEYHFDPGMVHLDGYTALVYARMRKADGDGDSDIKRTARQRNLMGILMQKVKTMKISDLQNMANEILPMITTNMSKEEITSTLAYMLPKLPTMEFKSGGTCPAEYSGVMVEIYHDGFYHSVLKFVPETTKKQMRELTLGEVPADK